jgi:hypothetical protein
MPAVKQVDIYCTVSAENVTFKTGVHTFYKNVGPTSKFSVQDFLYEASSR